LRRPNAKLQSGGYADLAMVDMCAAAAEVKERRRKDRSTRKKVAGESLRISPEDRVAITRKYLAGVFCVRISKGRRGCVSSAEEEALGREASLPARSRTSRRWEDFSQKEKMRYEEIERQQVC
jgi:hypothetical protein